MRGPGYSLYNDDKVLRNDGGALIKAGNYGNSLEFDGVNDYVSFGDFPTQIINASDEFTICVAFTYDNQASLYSYLISKSGNSLGNANYALYFDLNSGNPEIVTLDLYFDPYYIRKEVRYDFEVGNTYVLTVTKSGLDTITFYVNGQELPEYSFVNSGATLLSTPTVSTEMEIGARNLGEGCFKGYIHLIHFYREVLTPAEILSIYLTEGQLLTGKTYLGVWNFDETNGTTVNDLNLVETGTLVNYTLSDTEYGPDNKWVNAYTLSPITS
jgi:hypothetical protein